MSASADRIPTGRSLILFGLYRLGAILAAGTQLTADLEGRSFHQRERGIPDVKRMLSALLLLIPAVPFVAEASLIGQTATCSIASGNPNWTCSPASTTVVDPGTEFVGSFFGSAWFSVNIGSSDMVITNVHGNTITFGAGEVLTIGGLSGILGASLISTTRTTGVDASDISFTSSSVSVVLNGFSYSPGGSTDIGIRTASAPETGTLALLGLGLAGLATSRRRKQ